MTTDNAGGAGDGQTAGGQNGDGGGSGGAGGKKDDPKTVDFADHKRALDDMHKFKSAARESKERADKLQGELDAAKASSEQEKGNYKSLWESEKTAREEEKRNSERLKASVVRSERFRAVFPELKKAGLRDDAQNLIDKMDFDEIEVEATSNGRFLCHGTDLVVEKMRKEYPYAFEQKKAPKVNSSGGSSGGAGDGKQEWTPAKLVELEGQCRRKGNMEPYKSAYAEYLKQKQASR